MKKQKFKITDFTPKEYQTQKELVQQRTDLETSIEQIRTATDITGIDIVNPNGGIEEADILGSSKVSIHRLRIIKDLIIEELEERIGILNQQISGIGQVVVETAKAA